jgi:hypothetical protein
VVVVGVDGGADGFAPGAGAEGVDVFVLGQAGGLEESNPRRNQAPRSPHRSLAYFFSGDYLSANDLNTALGELCRRLGLGFFLGVVEAEMQVAADARGAAAAAIGESE